MFKVILLIVCSPIIIAGAIVAFTVVMYGLVLAFLAAFYAWLLGGAWLYNWSLWWKHRKDRYGSTLSAPR